MLRLSILVVAIVLVGCLFLGNTAAEKLRTEQTTALTSNDRNLADPSGRQILIKVQLVEVSLTKMKRLGFEISTFDGQSVHHFDGPTVFSGIGKELPEHFAATLEALRQNSLARVLTEATIATVDRRPASLSTGSTIQVNDSSTVKADGRSEFIGTKLKVVPQVVDIDRLYVELRLDWRGVDDSDNLDETTTPRVLFHGIDTTIDATFGETFVLAGSVRNVCKGDQTEETAVVLMVTPEWVDGERQPTVQVSQTPAARLKK